MIDPTIDAWFLWPAAALAAAVWALVPLGGEVLRRGVVFMDLAVAQAAAAVALWTWAWMEHGPAWATGAAGGAGALACAYAVAWVTRQWPQRREALIGLLYVLSASLAMLGARLDAHGREHLMELLAADVLWAQPPAVFAMAGAAAALATLRWRWPNAVHSDAVFYPVFAAVVSVAVPTLGLFLVFALLIGPALWARAPSPTLRTPLLMGWGAVACGLAGSWWWDAPSGPCVALACATVGLLSLFKAPSRASRTTEF